MWFLIGFLLGYLFGTMTTIVFVACSQYRENKKIINDGVIKLNGVNFMLTEI